MKALRGEGCSGCQNFEGGAVSRHFDKRYVNINKSSETDRWPHPLGQVRYCTVDTTIAENVAVMSVQYGSRSYSRSCSNTVSFTSILAVAGTAVHCTPKKRLQREGEGVDPKWSAFPSRDPEHSLNAGSAHVVVPAFVMSALVGQISEDLKMGREYALLGK